MDHRKLDSILKTAKDQSEHFFAQWDYELNPHKIQVRSRERKSRKYLPYFSKSKLGLAALACVLLVCLAVFQPGGIDHPSPEVSNTASITPVYWVNQTGYRGYEHPMINLLLAEDFVPKGSLGIMGGVLVEESSEGIVTRIIPYQMNYRGELVLSADRVLLQVGEELLLIGIDLPYMVEIGGEGYYIKKINETGSGYFSETRFSVHYPGEDWLQIIPKSDPTKSKSIYIKVID